jgi:hypothetical protein
MPSTHWIEGWVGSNAGVGVLAKENSSIAGNQILDIQPLSLVATVTELFWLLKQSQY